MNIPSHPHEPPSHGARYVAIVADGNRRWARAAGLPVSAGYEAGSDTLKARLYDAIDLGIEELTVYSFSTENWARPATEIGELISTLVTRIERETPELNRDGVRMRFIGRRDEASMPLAAAMDWAESMTESNRRITLCVAFNYGGRAEIIDAAKRFQGDSEEDFRRCLYAPDLHDPDLIIRTGGELRLSNYLLWQGAYSELVFREEMWPAFTRLALAESLAQFDSRSRRFGGRSAEPSAGDAGGEAHRLELRRVENLVDDRSIR
jgi:undecaprenyl diphosphate synthase